MRSALIWCLFEDGIDTLWQSGHLSRMTNSVTVTAGNPLLLKVKRFFFAMVAFLIVVAIGTVIFLMYASYGDGYRVGTILKMSKKGVIFKTYEGELSQGFLEGNQDTAGGVATRVWYFTVENDPKVLEQINHAIDTNKKVKAYYKEKYTHLPWVGDTRQIVFKVEEVL